HFAPEFEPTAYPLIPIRLGIWSGFLFISFTHDLPSLETFLGRIPTQVGHHRRKTTQQLFSHTRQVACNWKNYHDNTLCDYHVAIAHRKTLHPLQGPVKHYAHAFSDYTNLLFTPIPSHWAAGNTILPDLSPFAQASFLTYGIFPNLHLLAFPNGILAWIQITPLTVNTCNVHLEVYGVPDLSPPINELQAEFEAFMAEDIALTESVQKGYGSGYYQPGPANRLESRIIHQQQLILNALNA
ncbi:MAG: aromatic ring-hydroxylating dioxygenase subunit alpha, partial [Symploca sp. SIO2B6]|nr:aromatic ring-hydroxylating dioxygenase subunit alpha [Symploca sp. SIO2B6]